MRVFLHFSYVLFFSFRIEKNNKYLDKDKNQRSCISILTDLPNAIKKILNKISFHKHF